MLSNEWIFFKGGDQMAKIEESVEIKHPLDKVFTYTTDAKSWPEWQSFMLEAERLPRDHGVSAPRSKGSVA